MPEQIPDTTGFWSYTIAPGWQVFAGKTAFDNEQLSLRFARPNDYWFHVHDLPGSHVVLSGEQGIAPSRVLLEKAAAIAAWHSKARQSSRCSVDYTRAVNVSKPKGTPLGTVSITRNKLLKVKPGLPEPNVD
ncbi:MAG: NFACT RNA binding domain-containing protein [Lentisphaeria bacterium]